MSSTNRGYDRHASDYYVTPISTITRFLKAYRLALFDGTTPRIDSVLDPCAGGGLIGGLDYEMPYPSQINSSFGVHMCKIKTVDVREDSKAEIKRNFLEVSPSEFNGFDLIITNPPFYNATEIVEHSKLFLNDNPDSRIIILQRLNWLGSKARADFWTRCKPRYIFVDNVRPSFGGTKGTDSIEYAHFVFEKDRAETTELIMVHEYM